MRCLKFRCWDKRNNKMYDVYTLDLISPQKNIKLTGFTHNVPKEDSISGNGCRHLEEDVEFMQFTGLKDKNNLTDIYEGDIIDENGIVRGNIYESPSLFREGIDFVITEMGISSWRNTESIAMGRGCKYTK